jgi:hypothetical protein
MVVTVADGNVSGQLNWPGPAGFYQPVAMLDGKPVAGVSVAVREAPAATFGGAPACYLSADAVLTVSGDALAYELPLDSVDLKLAAACRDTVKVPKADLDWDGSVVVEGEAFTSEGGGEIQVSKEHGNTHGGACAFGWAKPGHWLEWTLAVPIDGDYVLTIVGASQETTILRSVDLDGKALAGAGVLRLEGTGGWGRVNPDEWQPYRPILDNGRPLRIRLAKGEHTLRLTNLVGQHFNVDAILLTPCK